MSTELVVGAFLLLMAVAMATLGTVRLLRNPELDRSRGLLNVRDRSDGPILPYRLAEYGTAVLLLVGGLGLVSGWAPGAWGFAVSLGFGVLAYLSLNGLAWALADRSRLRYAIPILIGLAGALITIALLMAGFELPLR